MIISNNRVCHSHIFVTEWSDYLGTTESQTCHQKDQKEQTRQVTKNNITRPIGASLEVGGYNLNMLCQVVELSSAAWPALGPLYELEQTMSIDIKRSIWLTVVDKILVDKQ